MKEIIKNNKDAIDKKSIPYDCAIYYRLHKIRSEHKKLKKSTPYINSALSTSIPLLAANPKNSSTINQQQLILIFANLMSNLMAVEMNNQYSHSIFSIQTSK